MNQAITDLLWQSGRYVVWQCLAWPCGPVWDDVQKMLNVRADGVRAGEIALLKSGDINWEQENDPVVGQVLRAASASTLSCWAVAL